MLGSDKYEKKEQNGKSYFDTCKYIYCSEGPKIYDLCNYDNATAATGYKDKAL